MAMAESGFDAGARRDDRVPGLRAIRDDLSEQIRAHPLLAVGVAVGIGYLLGSTGGGEDRDEGGETLRARLGRVVVAGLGALISRQLEARIAEPDE
jgi:hypothetical protein